MMGGRALRLCFCLALAACAAALARVDGAHAGEAAHHDRLYAMMQGLDARNRLVDPAPPVMDGCSGHEQTQGGDRVALLPVLCALPRSTDKPSSPGPNTSAVPPQQGSAGNQPAQAPGFAYYSPGALNPQDPSTGRAGDRFVYAPNIIFPLRLATGQQAYMNSQIWGHGGDGWDGKGEAGGSECDPINYDAMHQRDTYCEIRNWSTPMCPGGTGYQGQDIRPPTCKDNTWDAVAVVDGIITEVTTNTTVRLHGGDGTDYFYLHLHPQSIAVKAGQAVKQGDVLGRVSKYFGGDPNGTTIHLHFQVRQTIAVDGRPLSVYVPPYTSLIAAYRKAKGLDPGIGPDGNLVVDPQLEIVAAAASAQSPTPPAPAVPAPAPPAPTTPVPAPPAPTPPAPAVTAPAPPQPSPPGPVVPSPSTPSAPTPATPGAPPAPGQPSLAPSPSAQTPVPQPPPPASQSPSWWQKALDSAKGWWNKPTK
jgi:murein DD-endopeptidase MepM/ murein hydrolase activator NlpD